MLSAREKRRSTQSSDSNRLLAFLTKTLPPSIMRSINVKMEIVLSVGWDLPPQVVGLKIACLTSRSGYNEESISRVRCLLNSQPGENSLRCHAYAMQHGESRIYIASVGALSTAYRFIGSIQIFQLDAEKTCRPEDDPGYYCQALNGWTASKMK